MSQSQRDTRSDAAPSEFVADVVSVAVVVVVVVVVVTVIFVVVAEVMVAAVAVVVVVLVAAENAAVVLRNRSCENGLPLRSPPLQLVRDGRGL